MDDLPDKIERPRICLIDVDEECTQALKGNKLNCYSGSLGTLVKIPNEDRYSSHKCLLNYDFPPNMHEYDIVILDLQNPKTIPYKEEEHQYHQAKGNRRSYLLSSYPETLFDPRPCCAHILNSKLRSVVEKESIFLVFTAINETIEYQPIVVTPRGTENLSSDKYSLYDFYSDTPSAKNMTGKDTIVVFDKGTELCSLLESHNAGTTYDIVFKHPTHWEEGGYVKDKNFYPLIETKTKEIVSFAYQREKNITFFFPRIKNKADFLTDLVDRILPDIYPTLFPYNTQFVWLEDVQYRLPNEDELLREKKELRDDYEKSLAELDARIDANRQEYGFLHELLQQSGTKLVKTVEKYFGWLDFENVINVDETKPDLNEEDLRIETNLGLLVIEVKGIGGTSKDEECSQVSKFKYRRSKERGSFDVFALYIVNHQRYLPPEQRINPPFNDTQIQDAKNEERGLLTTYELFKLFFNIKNGYITKEDARNALFQTGLISFTPSNADMVSDQFEIHHNGYVVVLSLEDLVVTTGQKVILHDAGMLRPAEIVEIKIDDETVEKAESCEVGIKLSEKVSKDTEIWLRRGN